MWSHKSKVGQVCSVLQLYTDWVSYAGMLPPSIGKQCNILSWQLLLYSCCFVQHFYYFVFSSVARLFSLLNVLLYCILEKDRVNAKKKQHISCIVYVFLVFPVKFFTNYTEIYLRLNGSLYFNPDKLSLLKISTK